MYEIFSFLILYEHSWYLKMLVSELYEEYIGFSIMCDLFIFIIEKPIYSS